LALETSSFQPCGNPHRWWVSFEKGSSDAVRKLQAAARIDPVKVTFLGVLSEAGAYGHMGLFSREFVVREIRGRVEGPMKDGGR
jgi:hypothetical protein